MFLFVGVIKIRKLYFLKFKMNVAIFLKNANEKIEKINSKGINSSHLQ